MINDVLMSNIQPANTPAAPKVRSCIICRQRKVRCDKQSPCGNCRRAKIACVLPSSDRPPRWVGRIEHLVQSSASGNTRLDDRQNRMQKQILSLEETIRALRLQLEQAHSTIPSPNESSSPGLSSRQASEAAQSLKSQPSDHENINVNQHFGRMVIRDTAPGQYISSGFWSRIDDELRDLKTNALAIAGDDSHASSNDEGEQETGFTDDLTATTPDTRSRTNFPFPRFDPDSNLTNFADLYPLPSQIPFLLDVFSENINIIYGIIHLPTQIKACRGWREKGLLSLPYDEQALLFAISHAAITSMSEAQVFENFAASKYDLISRFRHGFEQSLLAAEFLIAPNLTLLRALVIFLLLARTHEHPRYIWMMVGLAVRMAQFLGLQRDGARFLPQMTPYEVEMRRRLWWAICILDMRAAEDQGTDYAIAFDSFDTEPPSNLNDSDIDPSSKTIPLPRQEITDSTFLRVGAGIAAIARQITLAGRKSSSLEEQDSILQELWRNYEREYLQHASENAPSMYLTTMSVVRVVYGKLTLFIYMPVLFDGGSSADALEVRSKLLIASIEVAEHNHALHVEPESQNWMWQWQSHTHWHAIVFAMLEITRREWSPSCERAWCAVQSRGMLPKQAPQDRDQSVWFPFRRLLAKARRHRSREISRLRGDAMVCTRVEEADLLMPVASTAGLLRGVDYAEFYRRRWRHLTGMPDLPSAVGEEPIIMDVPKFLQPRPSHAHSTTDSNTPTAVQVDNEFGSWPFLHPSEAFSSPEMDLVDLDLLQGESPDTNWLSWIQSAKGIGDLG